MDRIDAMKSQIRYSRGHAMVVDVASWTIGALDQGDRRDRLAILGGVYDWLRGIWTNDPNEHDDRLGAPETVIRHSLDRIFNASAALAEGHRASVPFPSTIMGNRFTAAILAATMPAALGIRTRLHVGGDHEGWKHLWAEADPLANKQFGYHMDLVGGRPLGERPEFERYGLIEVFELPMNGAEAHLNRNVPEAEIDLPPPEEGGHFRTRVPATWDGIKWELARMRRTIRAQARDRLVVQTAADIVSRLSPEERMDPKLRLAAMYDWVRMIFQYRDDPWGLEVIQTPHRMIRMAQVPPEIMGAILSPIFATRSETRLWDMDAIQPVAAKAFGDCDEAGELTTTLALSKPIACAPTADDEPERCEVDARLALGSISEKAPGYHHVWGEAGINGEWGYHMDPTEDQYDAVGKAGTHFAKRGYVRL